MSLGALLGEDPAAFKCGRAAQTWMSRAGGAGPGAPTPEPSVPAAAPEACTP